MRPLDMRPVGETELLVLWDDGHRSLYSHSYLRLHCPCAQCIEEWTGKRLLRPETVPADVRPLAQSPVGNYAVRFRWSDGHETGIYAFDLLRAICPCPPCAARSV